MDPHRPLHVLGVSGSLRTHSLNSALLRTAVALAPPALKVVPFEDLGRIPHFNQDVEAEGDPEAVVAWKGALAEADALLIVTPEYNAGLPGVLKNAVDWASRPAGRGPLRDKPVAIMGASPGRRGTARAQAHLRDVLASLGALVLPEPVVEVARAHDLFDGDLMLADNGTRDAVARLLTRFGDWVRTRAAEDAGTQS
jgi:chromate reductase, NAD(P)H dehydrogenase (quinone)